MRAKWPLVFLALALVSVTVAEEPAQKFDVVTPKDDGIIANAINERGEIVGFEWVEEKAHPGVVAQQPILARGKEITYLPLLEGYTASFPAAISDDGLVVGRVSKPLRPGVRAGLRNQAFVWDATSGIHGLGVLKDDFASFGCGISRDGRRISGFSLGENRNRVCVWDRKGDTWNITALPQEAQLASNVVAISNDGRYVAASDGVNACLWTCDASGAWKREVIAGVHLLTPRAVNNAGTVVGLAFTPDGLTHAAIWTRGEGYKQLPKPKGYVRSEASAINNAGLVVGTIDGPQGEKLPSRAFAYERGQTYLIEQGGPNFGGALAVNDHRQVAGVMEKDEDHAP